MEQPTHECGEAQAPKPQSPAPASRPSLQAASSAPVTAPPKPVHSLVLDANAIIKNEPTVSTLLAQAEELYTIPAVVSESASKSTTHVLRPTR